MAQGFKIADAYVEIHADSDSLGRDVDQIPAKVGPKAEKSGSGVGDKLSRGMSMSIMRNSPLIAAAIGGALAAGAPAAMAGASLLFGGVGAVAASQYSVVRDRWMQLGQEIRAGSVSDAAVLVPTYTGIATKIGTAYEALRPQLRDAFAEAGPQMDDFADSAIHAGTAISTSLVRAVIAGKPTMDGFDHLIERTGEGLAGFFDNISSHSPAAGKAMASLGDTVGELLPVVGDLLGSGSELAAVVLPAVATTVGAVAKAVGVLSPILPVVGAGFTGLKIAGVIGDMLPKVAGGLESTAIKAGVMTERFTGSAAAGERVMTSVGRVGSAVSSLGNALPFVGVAFALLGTQMEQQDQQIQKWGASLLEGGSAARQAREAMGDPSFMEKFTYNLTHWGNSQDVAAAQTKKATEAAREQYGAMNPLQQAQQDVTRETNNLSDAVSRYGRDSPQAQAASDALTSAQARLTQQQGELERATDGVTSAMVNQANQALAAADSNLGYRLSMDNTEQAAYDLSKAIQEHGKSSEEASDAALKLEQSVIAQAGAFGKAAADELPANTSELQKNATQQANTLAELLRLRDTMGSSFPASLNATIDKLQATTDQGAVTAAQFQALGAQVTSVPNGKYIDVQSPAPEQIQHMKDLGFRIETLPNGVVRLTPETANAEAMMNWTVRNRESWMTGVPNTGYAGSILDYTAHDRNAWITANPNAGYAASVMDWAAHDRSGYINGIPNASYANSYLDWAARARYSVIYTSVVGAGTTGGGGTNWRIATGGRVGDVKASKAFGVGGQVSGPGGPTDDLIPVYGPRSTVPDYRLSDSEWVIKAASTLKYGSALMKMVNDGTAIVSPPPKPVRGFATGGSVAGMVGQATQQARSLTIENLNVNLPAGSVVSTNPADVRRMAMQLRDELVKIEREYR